MDRAIVVGAYEFLGFHFCKKFLEEGLEVDAIHIQTNDKLFIEEKRMEIGRNANFTEHLSHNGEYQNGNIGETIVLIDYYDFFIKNCVRSMFNMIHSLRLSEDCRFAFLLPILLLTEDYKEEYEEIAEITYFMKSRDLFCQTFFLPTIFGPWQPDEFLFQQVLMQEYGEIQQWKLSEREWTGDALFVDDAVNCIFGLLKSGSTEHLLKSGKGNIWLKCARELSITITLPHGEVNGERFHGKETVMNTCTPYQIGLDSQKRHLRIIQDLRKELS